MLDKKAHRLFTVRIVALYVYVPVFTCVVSQNKLDWKLP